MKKILLTILCVFISLTFISCAKETPDKNDNATTEKDEIISSNIPEDEDESTNDVNLEYKGKSVIKVRLNSSAKMNIDIDAEMLKELENAENDTTIPDATLDMALGTVEIIYSDESTETIGTVYIGSDKALYLKFNNNKNKDAAYKLQESIF